MSPLRTAILGCGGFANKHAENIATMRDRLEVVGLCDCNEEKAVGFAQKYHWPDAGIFTDHHDMFAQTPLDLLVVCLPPYGHSDEVELAAARGTHVLIEKPIALTSQHAWKMVAAAEAAGIKTQVGFMYRFGAAVEALKRLIDSGEAGTVGLMSARYFCNALHASWWRAKDKSGGQLLEQIIHMVDLMRYLMGDPQTVFSLQNNLFHQDVQDYTVEDVSGTLMNFRSGGVGVIYASNGAIPGKWINDYRVVCKNLTADFSDANHATFTFTSQSFLQMHTISSEQDYYKLELLDLLQAIEQDGQTRTPIREGARSLDLALAANHSAECHSPVPVVSPADG